ASSQADKDIWQKIFDGLRENKTFRPLNKKDSYIFWASVVSTSEYSTEEALFFEEEVRKKERVIGFVCIALNKEALNRRSEDLLIKTILIGTAFWIIGSVITFAIVKRITNPLGRLTRGVNILESGGDVEEIPVETEDEIGKLANAFNRMSVALKKREKELRASEKKYRNIFENTTGGIFQFAPNGRLLIANPALAEILGYDSPAEIISNSMNIMELLDTGSEKKEAFRHSIEESGFTSRIEARCFRKDRTLVPVLIKVHAVRDENHSLLYYQGIITNITQQKRAERLKMEKEAAEAATQLKSEFLANMSHEIRTPMTAITGLIELALKTVLTNGQRDYLRKMQMSATSLLGIINDILDFSKMEAGKLDLENVNFRVSDLTENLSDILSHKAAEKGIDLSISVSEDVPPVLKGDSLRLSQVLINLISNAIKFTDKGEVTVIGMPDTDDDLSLPFHETEKEGSGDGEANIPELPTDDSRSGRQTNLRFSVSDTGIGISPDRLPRMFDFFTQADGSTTRQYGGTGLGLAICKRLVGMMGGRIWAESEVGRGSVFY
ncbi:ATP-binding protein, partial [Desulfobacterales bacterium HSG2]|nr:ATP-binding protein [Desulfobacterales bacterium HSG2]